MAKARGKQKKATPKIESCPLPNVVLAESEWGALRDALFQRPAKAVRRREDAAFGEGAHVSLPFDVEQVEWFEQGAYCVEEHQPGRYLSHAAGLYFVQDAGSMLALRLLAAQPAEVIADVCAAPGAKASSILEVVGPGGGFLLANEPIHGRTAALRSTLSRVGFANFVTTQLDVERLAEQSAEAFDAVLVDAPCTGQTLVGRGKQSAQVFSAEKVQHAAARQRRILAAAARMVRPAGRLIYSTCTFAIEENEGVVEAFLEQSPDWSVEPEATLAPWQSSFGPGGYRLFPHRERSAGAYAIRLRRAGDSEANARVGMHDAALRRAFPSADEVGVDWELEGECLGKLSGLDVLTRGGLQLAVPHCLPTNLASLALTGVELAYRPRKHWMPSHALALQRGSAFRATRVRELDDAEAISYLQGQPLSPGTAGWSVVRWRGHPLGWIRSNDLRANNGLPAAERMSVAPKLG